MTQDQEEVPIGVGTPIQITSKTYRCFGKTGKVVEGPERRTLGCVFDYLVRFDTPMDNGAVTFPCFRHELEVVP